MCNGNALGPFEGCITGMLQETQGPSPKSPEVIRGLQTESFLEGPLGSRVRSSCSLAVWHTPIPIRSLQDSEWIIKSDIVR